MTMHPRSFSGFSDPDLLSHFKQLITRDRATTAELLDCLAEIDRRQLYRAAGYPSMFVCCVREYGMSEDMAYKRIRAARTARRFPSVLAMINDGRLHLTAVVLLTPYLTRENAKELLAEAIRKTKTEIEELLARRFPRPDLPTRLTRIASRGVANAQLVPEPVCMTLSEQAPRSEPLGSAVAAESHGAVEPNPRPAACGGSAQLVPESVSAPPKIVPTSAERFGAQLSFGRETYELLSHVQCLLGHPVPTQDLAQVFHDALEAYARELEKRKYGATSCPRPRQRSQSRDPRYIPQRVKREVWKRDGARCTYVSDSGRRCEARFDLEFDHIEPIARGGESTTANLRLRCRAHNQLEAECVFGAGFMEAKRDAAHGSRRESAESGVGAYV
jgi:5-methylcytosine-specific restriction endonuclease McrA